MNKIKIIFFMIYSLSLYGSEKIYTQQEFDELVHSELTKRVDEFKRKSVADLAKELIQKERELTLKEQAIKQKDDVLESSRNDLENRIIAFEKEQKRVLGCIDQNEKDKSNRISQLVEVISNMKPEKASQLLSVQESDISVQILSLIDAQKASKIFNLMDKEISARLQKQYLDMKK
jgi:flagellar motility protein MotE (MotC chaperone)